MTRVTPTTVRPDGLAALRDAVLDSAGTLGIAGAGTAASWGGTLSYVDTVIDVGGLDGIITHNPGDMTVSVHAGTPLRELQTALADHGQQVSFDAARVSRGATVGGLVATADGGPAALVHGTLRDLVIGMTIVLADGTVARTGGHVIKNVTGYDLAKLMHGSYGTLGVVAEVVLRLHPVPEASATLAVDCTLDDAADHAARLFAQPLDPAAVEWYSTGSASGTLLVRMEGTVDALPRRVDRLRSVLGSGHDSASASDVWDSHAAAVRGAPGQAVLRIGARPSRLAALVASLPAHGAAVGLGTGVATVALPADAVADAHAGVHAAGGTSVLRDRTDGFTGHAWGPPPSATALLRSLKRTLDPDGRLGPGRLAPWLQEDPR
ncbi:MAG: FAD-binding protein [Pseudonocardia sp.]|uniref:FAD-binding oxidoreductase n=1 Tax=unclassified Pseudonocardia TaxID=2619320 RepID=UPI000868FBF8|nr:MULTISPECIES: FAD-binding protein [unclassified Pseudonocardia]MBN9111094.1 FAD-binding protein [Pseudonocardia sp.]ODU07241.1 MAG: dehydrogenase [Pseudonocardia sp. SCN 72-51]ODV05120.1 MAG: dehydrogenase [Pseudonocardia sp. SCN 73-27]